MIVNTSFKCDGCGRFFSGEDREATHDFQNLWDYHRETVIEDYTDYCGPCVNRSAVESHNKEVHAQGGHRPTTLLEEASDE